MHKIFHSNNNNTHPHTHNIIPENECAENVSDFHGILFHYVYYVCVCVCVYCVHVVAHFKLINIFIIYKYMYHRVVVHIHHYYIIYELYYHSLYTQYNFLCYIKNKLPKYVYMYIIILYCIR